MNIRPGQVYYDVKLQFTYKIVGEQVLDGHKCQPSLPDHPDIYYPCSIILQDVLVDTMTQLEKIIYNIPD